MDNNKPQKDRDTIVDILSSESEYEDDQRTDSATANKRAKTIVRSASKIFSFEGSEDGECSSNSYITSVRSSDDDYEDIESLTHNTPLLEKAQLKEKRKILSSKKAPKPPRPRKGPSLDTADLQLVKEIAEQTMKRRARVERLKALKKRRAVKSTPPPASSNISLFAMAVTVLFFIVIIFQGFGGFGSGQTSNLSFDGSPESSGAPSSGLISIQIGNNLNDVQQIAKPPKKLVQRKIYHTTSGFVEQKPVSNYKNSVNEQKSNV